VKPQVEPIITPSARRRQRLLRENAGLKQEVEELKQFLVEVSPVRI